MKSMNHTRLLRRPVLALALVVAASAGCRSSVSSSGTVGDRSVNLGGTAWAWIDSTRYEADDGAVELQERQTDETVLTMVMSGAVFDPAVDFEELSLDQRFQIADDIDDSDYLSLTIQRGNRVDVGDNLEYDSEDFDIPDTKPFITGVSFRLGRAALSRSSTYPDEVDVLASGRRVDLEVTTFDEESRFGGTMTLELFKEDGDDRKNVVESTLDITFDVEILPERLAECNFSPGGGGAADPCDDLDLAE